MLRALAKLSLVFLSIPNGDVYKGESLVKRSEHMSTVSWEMTVEKHFHVNYDLLYTIRFLPESQPGICKGPAGI